MSTALCCKPCGETTFPDALVVHLQGECCRCGEAVASSGCGSCSDDGECQECSAFNRTIVVGKTKGNQFLYEYKFLRTDFFSGQIPCSLERATLELIKHEKEGTIWYSACFALHFTSGSGKRSVSWYRAKLIDCCNMGILRRHIVGRMCCLPQFIEVQTVPTPDYAPPCPEWLRGNPDDLNDADYWPSMNMPLMQDSPEVGVRYFNGELQFRTKDLGSDGFGVPWGHTRIYSNRLSNSYDFGNGNNWLIHEWPQLVRRKTEPKLVTSLHFFDTAPTHSPTGCTIVMLRGTRNALWFDEFKNNKDSGTHWRSRFGAKQTLEFNRNTKCFRIITPHGHKWEFYAFSRLCFTPKRPQDIVHDRRLDGKLIRHVDPGGHSLKATYKDGRLSEFVRAFSPQRETFSYEYYEDGDNEGQLQYVTWKRGRAGQEKPLLRTEYTYYGKNELYGSLGDLKTAQTAFKVKEQEQDGGWKPQRDAVHYYRYARKNEGTATKQPNDTYCRGMLAIVVSPESYRRMAKDFYRTGGGQFRPEDVSDDDIAKYSDIAVTYHNSPKPALARKVESISLFGGSRRHTFAYEPPSDKNRLEAPNYNIWYATTIETRPDQSTKWVSSNFIGQTLRLDLKAGSDSWIHAWEYHPYHAGVLRSFTPACVSNPQRDPFHSRPTFKPLSPPQVAAGKVRQCTYSIINWNRAYLASVAESNGTNNSPDPPPESLVKSFCYDIVNSTYAIAALRSETDHGIGVIEKDKKIDGKTMFENSFQWSNVNQDSRDGLALLLQRRILLPKVSTDHFVGADRFLPKVQSACSCTSQAARDSKQKTTCGESENGGSGVAICNRYDSHGNIVENCDLRGTVTKYAVDIATGAPIRKTITSVIRPEQVVPGGSAKTQDLVFDYNADDFGRVTEVLGPAHLATVGPLGQAEKTVRSATWYLYKVFSSEVWTSQGYVSGTKRIFLNPVTIRRTDLAGRTTDEIVAIRRSAVSKLPPSMRQASAFSPSASQSGQIVGSDIGPPTSSEGAIPQSDWIRWTRQEYSADRTQVVNKAYHSIPDEGGGALHDNYRQTITQADIAKRKKTVEVSGGTRYEVNFEPRGLPTKLQSGCSAESLATLATIDYDDGTSGGNGNLTKMVRKDASGNRERTSNHNYDYRDRQNKVVEADGNTVAYEYSQQNAVHRMTRASEGGTVLAQQVELRDARGRVYLKQLNGYTYIDEVERDHLQEWFLYDEANQLVAIEGHGRAGHTLIGARPVTHLIYDGLGREIVRRSIAQRSWTLDYTLSQVETSYNECGDPLLVTIFRRFPDSAIGLLQSIGPLGNEQGTNRGRTGLTPGYVSSFGNWYDPLGRRLAASNFGSKSFDGVRPRLLDSKAYPTTMAQLNERGEVEVAADPLGNTTRFAYDDLGQCTATANNLSKPDFQELCEIGLAADVFIQDDATFASFGYTPEGKVSRTDVANLYTGGQTSFVSYGTDGVSNRAKLPPSAHLPRAVTDAENRTTAITYNTLGEVKTRTDPNGTVHEYEYDQSGRIIADKALFESDSIDRSITEIHYNYDEFGRLASAWSANPAYFGLVINSVDRVYGSYNELIVEGQFHHRDLSQVLSSGSGFYNNVDRYHGEASQMPAVGAAGVFGAVAYYYDYPTPSDNVHRLNTVWYPGGRSQDSQFPEVNNGRFVSYLASSLDIAIGRTSGLEENRESAPTAQYEYFGAASVYGTRLNRTKKMPLRSSLTIPGGAAFSSLDSLGRQWDCRWELGQGGATLVEHVQAKRDFKSNLQWRKSRLSDVKLSFGNDDLFKRDRLDRILRHDRGQVFLKIPTPVVGNGVLQATPIIQPPQKYLQHWERDQNSNWRKWRRKNFLTDVEQIQDREHSRTNDIRLFARTVWPKPEYDAAGNMIRIPQPGQPSLELKAGYDAWGRLSSLSDQANNWTRFDYDALGRRIMQSRQSGEQDDRHFYYDNAGRAICEMVGRMFQQVLDREYIWDANRPGRLVCRIRHLEAGIERLYPVYDMLGNVTAIVDEDGNVKERYLYDLQGHVTFLNENFVEHVTQQSNYEWEYLFGGMRFDRVTGLHFAGSAYYHPDLGRVLPCGSTPVLSESTVNGYVQDFPFGSWRAGWFQRTSDSLYKMAEPVFKYLSEQSPWIKFGIGLTCLVVTTGILIGATFVSPATWLNNIGAICGAAQAGIGAYYSEGADFGDVMLGVGLGAAFGAVCPLGGIGSLVGAAAGVSIAAMAYGDDPKALVQGWQWGGLIGGSVGAIGDSGLQAAKFGTRRAFGAGIANLGLDLAGGGGGAIYGYWQDGTSATALRWAQLGMMGTNVTAGLARGAWGVLRAENLRRPRFSHLDLNLLGDLDPEGLRYISKRHDIDPEGFLDVIGHANEFSFSNRGKSMAPVDLADLLIKETGDYVGQPVRLLSCLSGFGGKKSYAQKLSNILGVRVRASPGLLGADEEGFHWINHVLLDSNGNIVRNSKGLPIPDYSKGYLEFVDFDPQ